MIATRAWASATYTDIYSCAVTQIRCLYLLTILKGDRESLAGVGLILNQTGAAAQLKALDESYRDIRGMFKVIASHVWKSMSRALYSHEQF